MDVCEATSRPSLYCDRLFKNHKKRVSLLIKVCMTVFAFVCLDKAHRPGM